MVWVIILDNLTDNSSWKIVFFVTNYLKLFQMNKIRYKDMIEGINSIDTHLLLADSEFLP